MDAGRVLDRNHQIASEYYRADDLSTGTALGTGRRRRRGGSLDSAEVAHDVAGGARVQRILKLIGILRSEEICSADTLAEKTGVSRRTAFRDLEVMALCGIPCRFDPIRKGYRISDWYFLPPLSLTLPESLGLLIAADKVVCSKGYPFSAEASQAVKKVIQSLPDSVRTACQRMSEVVDVRWPAVVDATVTREVFQRLLEAASSRRKVTVSYDMMGQEATFLLHPHVLVLHRRMWCLLAYSEQSRRVQSFKLDRILAAHVSEMPFVEPKEFSLDAYLGNAWDIMPEGKTWSVRLRFASTVACDVEEILWHKTQQTRRLEDGSLLFDVEVDGLTEISSWVMGYADQVFVERPAELRHRVREMAEGIVNQYRR